MLGDSIAKTKGKKLDNLKDIQRDGIIGPRKKVNWIFCDTGW